LQAREASQFNRSERLHQGDIGVSALASCLCRADCERIGGSPARQQLPFQIEVANLK
jgi:hypothetical protein